jgi:hypothetical protein
LEDEGELQYTRIAARLGTGRRRVVERIRSRNLLVGVWPGVGEVFLEMVKLGRLYVEELDTGMTMWLLTRRPGYAASEGNGPFIGCEIELDPDDAPLIQALSCIDKESTGTDVRSRKGQRLVVGKLQSS